jgi:A/G-specific adenine glycosylase
VDDAALRRSLLAWYRREARDLPWRRTADPYAIWVSEIMLQQTRVDVAKPYFQRWMARFPTVHALAAAKEEAVLQAWSGLGYYRRARNLHAAARRIAADGMPSDAASLRELPGVGAYTAGAIASIAFGERVPAVDGNVVRVLARLHAWTGSASSPRLTKQVQAAAERLVPARGAGDWNQALMDLGATVCTPKAPRCDSCPVARLCKAKARGRQGRIPAPKGRPKARAERRHYAVARRGDKVLFVRNPPRGLLAGLWMLPGGPADEDLSVLVERQTGHRVVQAGPSFPARHQFSHRTWEMAVHEVSLRRGRTSADVAWLGAEDLADAAVPAAARVALAAAQGKAKRRRGSARP